MIKMGNFQHEGNCRISSMQEMQSISAHAENRNAVFKRKKEG